MGWFRVTSSRLRYRGRLSQEPYSAWARTSHGSEIIEARARLDRLRVFARPRAQRRIWRELERAARRAPLSTAIQLEADQFGSAMVAASHALGLPHRSIALHRLVIVPRVLVAAPTRQAVRRRLSDSESLEALDSHVRDFFCEQLVMELDAAVAEHRPSIARPVVTQEGWGCVGHDTGYQWVDPIFSGPEWGGHFVMYQFPRQGLSRRTRKEVDSAVGELQHGLASISRSQRQEIMRTAVDGLQGAMG